MAFFVGFPTLATAIVGADCAVHMSEEIQSAPLVVPRALMYTVLINGALALGMAIAMVFCISDLDAASESHCSSMDTPIPLRLPKYNS